MPDLIDASQVYVSAVDSSALPVLGVWTSIDTTLSTQELEAKYRSLRSLGINTIFLGGGIDRREFQVIKDLNLQLHSWVWTTNRNERELRNDHPDWFMVSRSGKSCFDDPPYVDYYRWLCPDRTEVHGYLREKMAELASEVFIDAVHLDYVRYPDVILPRALWDTYGLDQTEELPDYDFCYCEASRELFKAKFGRDPLGVKDPSVDQDWLHFRYRSVVRLVQALQQEVKAHNKLISAAVFPTPRLARKICRQSWSEFHLDFYCPMIYHSFYNEDLAWIGECVRENIQSASQPIVAGLYLPGFNDAEELKVGAAIAQSNGAKGCALFGDLNQLDINSVRAALGIFREPAEATP